MCKRRSGNFQDRKNADDMFKDVSSAVIPDVLEPYNKCISVSVAAFRILRITVKADKISLKPQGFMFLEMFFDKSDVKFAALPSGETSLSE